MRASPCLNPRWRECSSRARQRAFRTERELCMPEVATVAPPTGYLVGGKWITNGKTVDIHSPYDHSVVGTAVFADRSQLEHAIASAAQAFEITRKMSSFERQRVLRNVADQIQRDREELARGIALEAGKPIKMARVEA